MCCALERKGREKGEYREKGWRRAGLAWLPGEGAEADRLTLQAALQT